MNRLLLTMGLSAACLLNCPVFAATPQVTQVTVHTHSPYGLPSRYAVDLVLDRATANASYKLQWFVTVASSAIKCTANGSCSSSAKDFSAVNEGASCFGNAQGEQPLAAGLLTPQFFLEQVNACDFKRFDVYVGVVAPATGATTGSTATHKTSFTTGKALPQKLSPVTQTPPRSLSPVSPSVKSAAEEIKQR